MTAHILDRPLQHGRRASQPTAVPTSPGAPADGCQFKSDVTPFQWGKGGFAFRLEKLDSFATSSALQAGLGGEETGGGNAVSRAGKSTRIAGLRGEAFRSLVVKWLGITEAFKIGREMPDKSYGYVNTRTLLRRTRFSSIPPIPGHIDLVEWLEEEFRAPAVSGVLSIF